MKKIKYFLLLLSIMFCSCGCIRYDVAITLNKDGSANITDTVMVKNEVISFEDDGYDELLEKVREINNKGIPGAFAEIVEHNGYTGVKFSYKVPDVSSYSIKNDNATVINIYKTSHTSGKIIDVERKLFETTYDIDILADYSINPQNLQEHDYNIAKFIEGKLIINTPVKANRNNATTANDELHSYVWIYNNSADENHMYINYSVLNVRNILLVILITLFILILIITVLVSIILNNKHHHQEKPAQPQMVDCPYCGERVLASAVKCKYCGEWLTDEHCEISVGFGLYNPVVKLILVFWTIIGILFGIMALTSEDGIFFMLFPLMGYVATYVYLLPAIYAASRKHPQFAPILLINLFLGGTVIGWVGALIWANTHRLGRHTHW